MIFKSSCRKWRRVCKTIQHKGKSIFTKILKRTLWLNKNKRSSKKKKGYFFTHDWRFDKYIVLTFVFKEKEEKRKVVIRGVSKYIIG